MKIIYEDKDSTVSQTSLLIMSIINVLTFKKIDKVDRYVKNKKKKMVEEFEKSKDKL